MMNRQSGRAESMSWRFSGRVLAAGLALAVLVLFAVFGGLAGSNDRAGVEEDASAADTQRQRLLDHDLRRLNSDETVNLFEHFTDEPLLIVNTASRCGFTGQFAGLEALHQRYREDGLRVVGFSSNDFRQEIADEEAVAEVCFINFGVTFDMFASIGVRGQGAHPLFQELARQSEPPGWNFHKYLVDRDGRVVEAFSSRVSPDDPALQSAIEALL